MNSQEIVDLQRTNSDKNASLLENRPGLELTSDPSCSCFVTCLDISIQTVAFFLTAASDSCSTYCGFSPILKVSFFGPCDTGQKS
jgi:hypothetical protein